MKKSTLQLILLCICVVLVGIFVYKLIFVQPPKNLLLISIDTLRPDHMGTYGYEKNTTPNIDEWAEKGTVFTNVRTVVPMTDPSFAALMTGKTPVKTRIITNGGIPISKNTKTLAKILSENGFYTSAILAKFPVKQGFDEIKSAPYVGYYYPEGAVDKSKVLYRHLNSLGEYEKFILSSTDWLKANKDKKFFLWVHLMDIHAPYFPPQDLRCKFNSKYCKEIMGKSEEDLDKLRAEYQICQEDEVPGERIELMETLYDGGVASADRLTGKILDTLKELNLDKNTLVVIYSDHGEGFDHNYFFNHREVLYDSAVKIPLIFIDPTAKGPAQSDLMVQNMDIMPSILEMLGVNSNSYRFDGKSFAGVFDALPIPTKVRDFSILVNNSWTKYAITDGQFKYIYSLPESCVNNGQTEELYNLVDDPKETNNVIKTNKKEAESLKNKMFDYLSDYNLPGDSKKSGVVEPDPDDDVYDLNSLGY